MNEDFLEWLVGYAEEFELWFLEELSRLTNMPYNWKGIEIANIEFSYKEIKDNLNENWQKAILPLLLQKAIEGINRVGLGLEISQDSHWILVRHLKGDDIDRFFVFKKINLFDGKNKIIKSEDEAKEAALKYIYEEIK